MVHSDVQSIEPASGVPREVATTPRAKKARIAWILFGLAVVVTLYPWKVSHRLPDFEVCRKTAARVLAAEPLYRESDGHWKFKYLPANGVIWAPVALLPREVSRAMWYAAMVALLVVLLRTSASLIPAPLYSRGLLIGATFVLLGKFFVHEIDLGNFNLLMAALVVYAAYCMTRGREALAGALVALAIVIKPYAVLFVPYVLARRRLASIASLLVVFGLALILPAAIYGWEGNAKLLSDWWMTVTSSTDRLLDDRNNVSALSVFTRSLGHGGPAPMLALATVVVLLATAALVFFMRGPIASPEGLEIGILLTMIPIISPQGWDYVFLIAAPGVMYLVNYQSKLPHVLRALVIAALLVVAFSIFDVVGRTAYTAVMKYSVIPICYVVQIAGMAALRARRVA
jgi:hypothetical protein